jgi:hypothetical protein
VLSLLALLAAGLPQAAAPDPAPVLVELFTSEGCSSCPPADRLLARMARERTASGVPIVALGEHVDYWDGLGWRDALSSPAWSRRQEGYARRRGGGVYTPQLLVDGHLEALGSDEAAVRAAIARAAREPKGRIDLRLAGGTPPVVEVEARWGPVPAELFLAVVEEGVRHRVERGENAGRTLEHAAAALSLTRLASGTGRLSGRFPVPLPAGRRGRLRAVAFVQEPDRGPVHAAAELDLGAE